MTQPQLLDLKILARQAGAILREGFGRQHQVDYKSLTDIVTEIDRQSEEFLTGQVLCRFPGDTIQGEEGGLTQGKNERVWHIDPLDGTVNYAHGVPIFSVSLACAWDGAVQLGVVYDPMRDEMFSARRGQGAWLNDAPIHVSQTEELVSALLVTGFPYTIREQEATNLDHFTHFCMHARALGAPPGVGGPGPVLCSRRATGWLLGNRHPFLGRGRRRLDCGRGRRARYHPAR